MRFDAWLKFLLRVGLGAFACLGLQGLQKLNAALLQLLVLQGDQFILSQIAMVVIYLPLRCVLRGVIKLLGFHI